MHLSISACRLIRTGLTLHYKKEHPHLLNCERMNTINIDFNGSIL